MKLKKCFLKPNTSIHIGGSKSITNRLLVLQALNSNFQLDNISEAQDSNLLAKALCSEEEIVDIHHAGTAMRFLTAFFAITSGKTTILTGSNRMKQRPIKALVEALQSLGADISYLENNGFPPLKIKGQEITKNKVEISANISSQFVTALMLIGTSLKNGLQIKLLGETTSKAYLEMTANIICEVFDNQKSVVINWENSLITINYQNKIPKKMAYHIESDWSSASYFYSLCAIGRQKIHLTSFFKNSLQGDSIIANLYSKFFGIETIYNHNEIQLVPQHNFSFPKNIKLNMNNCPDIAQTLAVTATSLKIAFEISGLATLKIKETDRLIALKNELKKLGCKTEITENSIKSISFSEPKENILIKTYQDHRMAMAFAAFALLKDLEIEDETVVEKSYPSFWKDWKKITE